MTQVCHTLSTCLSNYIVLDNFTRILKLFFLSFKGTVKHCIHETSFFLVCCPTLPKPRPESVTTEECED